MGSIYYPNECHLIIRLKVLALTSWQAIIVEHTRMCGYSYWYRVKIQVATLPIYNAIEFEKVNCFFITALVLESTTLFSPRLPICPSPHGLSNEKKRLWYALYKWELNLLILTQLFIKIQSKIEVRDKPRGFSLPLGRREPKTTEHSKKGVSVHNPNIPCCNIHPDINDVCKIYIHTG